MLNNRSLLVICFKYSSVYMSISNSQSGLSTTDRHLPSTSKRLKSGAASAADLQPLKEFKMERKKWENWQDRSSDSQIHSGADFMSLILESLHIL